ncbi:MAG: HAD family hydrolase [Nanoarchaeota archaeon]
MVYKKHKKRGKTKTKNSRTISRKLKTKAIIFDLGGVLVLGKKFSLPHKTTWSTHKYVSSILGFDLDSYFEAIETPYSNAIQGKITKKQALKILSRRLKTTPRKLEKIYKKSYKNHFKQNKKLQRFAVNLKKRGYKIAILSDQWPVSQEVLIRKKLKNNFDKVIVSCDSSIKARKPSKKIYKLALKKLSIKPYEALFVDNREWNTKPADKLGLKTILFKNNKQVISEINSILEK